MRSLASSNRAAEIQACSGGQQAFNEDGSLQPERLAAGTGDSMQIALAATLLSPVRGFHD